MLLNVKIFVGGTWILIPKLKYVDGLEESFFIEHDELTIGHIHDRVIRSGHHNAVHYDVKYPWEEMEEGIKGLRKEKHMKKIIAEMVRNGEDTLEVYVEHGINTPIMVVNLESSEDEMGNVVSGAEDERGGDMYVGSGALLLTYGDEVAVENESVDGDRDRDGDKDGDKNEYVDGDRDSGGDNNERGPAASPKSNEDGIDDEGDGPENDGEGPEKDGDGPENIGDGDDEHSYDSHADRTYSWEVHDCSSGSEHFSDFLDSENEVEADIFEEADVGVDKEFEEVAEGVERAGVGVEQASVGVEQGRSERVKRPSVAHFGPGVVDVETDEEDSDKLVSPPCSDSEDERERMKARFPVFNQSIDMVGEIKLEVGMKFATPDVFRKALQIHSLQIGHDFRFEKNEKSRITAHCKNKCGWRIHASASADKNSFQIKSYSSTHYCGKDIENRRASASWIAHTYLADFRENLDTDLDILANRVGKEHFVSISRYKMVRAKKIAQTLIEGEHAEQYKLLWSYAEAIRSSNPRSTVKITATRGVFKRIYICLSACKRGFLTGCRPLIGIDGCHLKGRYKGHLLAAIGKDANGNIFPIAWSVVDSECKDNWWWFLQRLEDDLGSLNAWCFMSDRQKGLQNIFDTVLKEVDHRYCVRHIWNNFKSEFGGSQYMKDQLWDAARAYTATKFNIHMEKIKCEKPAAYDWLKRIPPHRWSRHAFNPWVMCDLLLNNLSESFNSYIRLARKKPILTCLETIRRLLMRRFYMKYQGMMLYEGMICPRWFNRLEKCIQECQSYIVYPHSQLQKFEVEHMSGEKCTIDLQLRTCSCKKWDLTGVPCRHAAAAILFFKKSPHDFVHVAYRKSTFMESYKDGILPVPDQSEWPVVQGHHDVRPPKHTLQSGRPRHKRRREAGETGPSNPNRVRRSGSVMTCRNCKGKNHNIRTCPLPMRSNIPPLRRKKQRTNAGATSTPTNNGEPEPEVQGNDGDATVGATSTPTNNGEPQPEIQGNDGDATAGATSTPTNNGEPQPEIQGIDGDATAGATSTPTNNGEPQPEIQGNDGDATAGAGFSRTTRQRPKKKRIWRPAGVSGSFCPPRPQTRSNAPEPVQPSTTSRSTRSQVRNNRKWIP